MRKNSRTVWSTAHRSCWPTSTNGRSPIASGRWRSPAELAAARRGPSSPQPLHHPVCEGRAPGHEHQAIERFEAGNDPDVAAWNDVAKPKRRVGRDRKVEVVLEPSLAADRRTHQMPAAHFVEEGETQFIDDRFKQMGHEQRHQHDWQWVPESLLLRGD